MGFVRKKRLFLMMLLPLRIIMNLRNIRNQTLSKKLITNIIGRITYKHLCEKSLNFPTQYDFFGIIVITCISRNIQYNENPQKGEEKSYFLC